MIRISGHSPWRKQLRADAGLLIKQLRESEGQDLAFTLAKLFI